MGNQTDPPADRAGTPNQVIGKRRWSQSQGGLGQVVFVSGEAGIGKSALVAGLRAQVRAEGFPRIAFRGSAKLLAVFVVDTTETELTIPFGN